MILHSYIVKWDCTKLKFNIRKFFFSFSFFISWDYLYYDVKCMKAHKVQISDISKHVNKSMMYWDFES